MAKGLCIDEGGGVIGVMPTRDGGTAITKGGNPIPKGGTPFSRSGSPATEDATQITECGSPTRKGGTQIPKGGTPAAKYGTRIAKYGTPYLKACPPATKDRTQITKGGSSTTNSDSPWSKDGPRATKNATLITKCGIRTMVSMWSLHMTTDCNVEPGSHLSSTVLENDPQADIDKCQGEMASGHWSNHKQTSTLGNNEEIRFLTDTSTRHNSDEYEEVTKATEQSLNKCLSKGRGVLRPMSAATVLKRCLSLIVLIWVAPLSAAFIDVSGPTSLYAGCNLQLRCEGRDANDLLWFQGLGGNKRSIDPSPGGRYEIDGPSQSRPFGVLSMTLTIRNASEEDSGTYLCYDGKGRNGFQHKVEVLPGISCGSFTPPDDMWSEYHCDHVTVGCMNNSGSWSLLCLNDTWHGQYGPCHEMDAPIDHGNDCTMQIAVTFSVFIIIGVVVFAVVICKGWCKKRSSTLSSTKAKIEVAISDCVDNCWV